MKIEISKLLMLISFILGSLTMLVLVSKHPILFASLLVSAGFYFLGKYTEKN